MTNSIPSQLLEKAVSEFSKLPGVGRKTALRLVLHLLRQPCEEVEEFAEAIARVRKDIKHCSVCHNISDTDVCPICSDPRREKAVICVVENIQDVMAVENTQQYHGLYHVLGGIISPMDGIGPSDIEIESLVERVGQGGGGRGHPCVGEYDGRRHHQFLYPAQTAAVWGENQCDSPRYLCWRRTGIYR